MWPAGGCRLGGGRRLRGGRRRGRNWLHGSGEGGNRRRYWLRRSSGGRRRRGLNRSTQRLRIRRLRRWSELAVGRIHGSLRQQVLVPRKLHSPGIGRLHAHWSGGRGNHRDAVAGMADNGPRPHQNEQGAAERHGDDGQTFRRRVHATRGNPIGRGPQIDLIRHRSSFPPGQRISSTGVTPMTARPERITTAVAATSASCAKLSVGRSACRNRSVASSFPLFHSI